MDREVSMTVSGGGAWRRQVQVLREADRGQQMPSWATWKRIGTYARPYGRLMVLLLVLVVVGSALEVLPPLLLRHIIDAGVVGGNVSAVWWGAGLVAVVALLGFGQVLAERWCQATVGEGLIRDLRLRVFGHVLAMPLSFFARAQTGKLVSRIGSDVLGAQRTFTSTFSSAVTSVARLGFGLTAMLLLNPWLALLAVVVVPLFLIPARIVGSRLAGLARESADLNGEITTAMTERFTVSGALLVKLFGRPREEHAVFDTAASAMARVGVRTALTTRFFVSAMTLCLALTTAAIYALGGWWAWRGDVSLGTLTALVGLLPMVNGPLITLSNLRVDLVSAVVSFERVFEVLDTKPAVTDAEDAVEAPAEPRIEFDDVWFSYPGDDDMLASVTSGAAAESREPVLRGVSFTVEPGQTVALVGPSGGGKTTLTHLIARLYDVTSGQVRLGGTDVRRLTAASVRQRLGYVTQDAHMFHDTVANNLRYARPDVTEAEMWEAMEAAQIADLVRRLPDGLDTVVGERGYRLSGGERQRLAIARLLVKAPPMVVLDEATAHLDSDSERAVQRALDAAMERRTSVVIAHRLSTVREASLILVVEDGRIVERGRHNELLAAQGTYATLHRTQFADD